MMEYKRATVKALQRLPARLGSYCYCSPDRSHGMKMILQDLLGG